MAAVRNLNMAYNRFQIYFKYRGFHIMDSPSSLDFVDLRLEGDSFSPNLHTPAELNEFSIASQYQSNNAINIFVVRNFYQAEEGVETILPGYYYNGMNSNIGITMPNLMIMRDFFTTAVLLHEMGHMFGGIHTNKNGVGLTPPTYSYCEHVTRNVTVIPDLTWGYNAESTADLLLDTPASPSYYEDEDVDSEGVYIGTQRDCTGWQGAGLPYLPGRLYNEFTVPIKNIMNVNRIEDIQFQKEFTIGQGQKFRDNIAWTNALMFNQIETDISSLYEPFERSQIAENVVTSVDLGNGYANVCRTKLELHRFQPGFNYVFPDNNGDPDLVYPSIYSIPFNVNHTSSYPIIINQVDPDFVGTVPLVCTRGLVCAEEEIIGATDLITDFLGSYNFSLEQWDKLKASDPNFYDYLQSQKYHIIRKETKTGVIIQVIIYKP